MNKIYLASKSPRRKMLLKQINVDFELIDSEIDESINDGEIALDYVRRMSIEKATAGFKSEYNLKKYPILAADTSVVINDLVLGKPNERKGAFEMLNLLSGKTHQVITCVSLLSQNSAGLKLNGSPENDQITIETIDSITNVSFISLSPEQIDEYLDTQEWSGKAGSYGIQGYAAKFIKSIEGSYSGVVGLPLYETDQLFNELKLKNRCER